MPLMEICDRVQLHYFCANKQTIFELDWLSVYVILTCLSFWLCKWCLQFALGNGNYKWFGGPVNRQLSKTRGPQQALPNDRSCIWCLWCLPEYCLIQSNSTTLVSKTEEATVIPYPKISSWGRRQEDCHYFRYRRLSSTDYHHNRSCHGRWYEYAVAWRTYRAARFNILILYFVPRR
jgi:hypothetical protein